MRSEEFERLRRVLQLNHNSGHRSAPAMGLGFDPARPWDGVFAAAAHPLCLESLSFWQREVRDKAVLYLTRVRTQAVVSAHGADDDERPPVILKKGPGKNKKPKKGKHKGDGKGGGGSNFPKGRGDEDCYAYGKGM